MSDSTDAQVDNDERGESAFIEQRTGPSVRAQRPTTADNERYATTYLGGPRLCVIFRVLNSGRASDVV